MSSSGPTPSSPCPRPCRPTRWRGATHARNGDILHSLTFGVADLDRAEAHLRQHGIGLAARDDATLIADPADTYGAVLGFTTGIL